MKKHSPQFSLLFFSLLLFFLDFILIICGVDRFNSLYDYFSCEEIVIGKVINKNEHKFKHKVEYVVNINDQTKDITLAATNKYQVGDTVSLRCGEKEKYFFNENSFLGGKFESILILALVCLGTLIVSCLSLLFFVSFIASVVLFIMYRYKPSKIKL